MTRNFLFIFVLGLSLTCVACDRDASATSSAPTRGGAAGLPSAAVSVPTFGTASIKGVVHFAGTPPAAETIANKPCCEGAPELKDESVVLNSNHTLANVFVYLTGVEPSDGSSRQPALIDQKFCRYTPHVIAIQTGQPLRVRSSDATLHNVHYNADVNPANNFALVQAGAEKTIDFKAAEFVHLKCDVHPWMSGYVGVFDNPFFAVTNTADGAYAIDKVPAGTYTLIAWHERFGKIEKEVSVKDGQAVSIDLAYEQK